MRQVFVFIMLFGPTGLAGAAPSAELWERWAAHDPDSEATIDHSAWSAFLGKYIVRGEASLDLNRVRYGAVSDADKKALQTYIERLENTAIGDYDRAVQQAFWLNLYNTATLDLILENYPVESIRDLGEGFFASGPWDDKLVTVDGAELSLNDIEHRILRPIWETPLNHYGVNCASVGCPNLMQQAFTGENVGELLRTNAAAYINSPRGARIEDGKLTASKIYDWYQADFGGSVAGVITHMRRYATPQRSARLDAIGDIHDYAYDWSLNDAK